MERKEYYRKVMIINLCLIMFHISTFVGFTMSLAGLGSIDSVFLAIPYIIFILGLQFLVHSIPNIIIYKKMKNFNDIKSFIKIEVITFGLMILSYASLFLLSSLE